MTSSDVTVDTSEWDRFQRRAPKSIEKAALTYFQRGGQHVRRMQAEESKKRLGKERAQSRMRTVDPTRPKGQYRGSIRPEIRQTERQALIGPNVPYRWWVELGKEAPAGAIPETHRGASFRGHRIVEHGTEASRPGLATIFHRVVDDALQEATS